MEKPSKVQNGEGGVRVDAPGGFSSPEHTERRTRRGSVGTVASAADIQNVVPPARVTKFGFFKVPDFLRTSGPLETKKPRRDLGVWGLAPSFFPLRDRFRSNPKKITIDYEVVPSLTEEYWTR